MEFLLSRTSNDGYGRKSTIESIGVNSKKYKLKVKKFYNRQWSKKEDRVFIEINSLEELMKLQKDYGDLVIMNNYDNKKQKEIEIYDDYRE